MDRGGNVYRHDYDNVANFVWRTVNEDVPAILEMVRREMGGGSS